MTNFTNAALTTNAGQSLRPFDFVISAVQTLQRWYRCRRDMRHLMELDDHLLRDVGLTREEVARAAAKFR